MSSYTSDKIKLLSFFAIILVMYIHTGYTFEIETMLFNMALQKFVRIDIARYAVPLFFVISGYLFWNTRDFSIEDIISKMKRRVVSLLIPFIIAKITFLLFTLFVELNNGSNVLWNILCNQSIINSIIDVFYATEGIPWVMHLWFLRDLIIIVALSPILYVLIKYINRWLLFLLLLIVQAFWLPLIPFHSIFFFIAGGIIIPHLIRDIKNRREILLCAIIFFLLLVVEHTGYTLLLPTFVRNILSPITLLLGVILIWVLYDLVLPKGYQLVEHKYMSVLVGSTFFIYLYHIPTIHVVRKGLVFIVGHSSIGYAITFILSPIIFVVIFSYIGLFLKRYIPNAYGVIVGGR